MRARRSPAGSEPASQSVRAARAGEASSHVPRLDSAAVRIATWNVNSIRARLPRALEFLAREAPDVVCLQETKVVDDLFPRAELEDAGYTAVFHGQKTYNGVALLARGRIEDVTFGLPGTEHSDARVLAAAVGDVLLLNLYVVNGQEVGSAKYAYKLAWLNDVARYVAERFPMSEKVVVTGDFNVTFDDRDVYDPVAWHEKILCSTPERDALARVMEPGLRDALRKHTQEAGIHTWWDFRTRAFSRGAGLRIDHFLLSPPAYEACSSVVVDLASREGERPSDHAAVIATFV
jgi:exodeoxyribonuclease-3